MNFSVDVTRSFSNNEESALELWRPVAQEFDRGGPEAAKEYLEAERQRLVERVEDLLSQVEGE